MVVLETERLILRHLEPDDLQDLFELYRDPEMRKYYPEGTLTLEETREELEWFLNGHPRHPELGLWATIHKETGRFIGRCGLLPWTIEGELEVEIAYMIAKTHSRQGLGSEVARALVRYGFEELGRTRLIALIDEGHVASIKTAESASLRFEKDLVLDGTPCRVYSITKS